MYSSKARTQKEKKGNLLNKFEQVIKQKKKKQIYVKKMFDSVREVLLY